MMITPPLNSIYQYSKQTLFKWSLFLLFYSRDKGHAVLKTQAAFGGYKSTNISFQIMEYPKAQFSEKDFPVLMKGSVFL